MFKYGRIQKRIPSWLVCGSYGMCLDCTLPGVQVATGLGFFLHSNNLIDCEDSDSLVLRSQTAFSFRLGMAKKGLVSK